MLEKPLLYLVTDRLGLNQQQFLERIELACQGGVDLLQLREKEISSAEYYKLAGHVKKITDRYQVPLIIDDQVAIAQAVDAAGVHLGQADLPVVVARRILDPTRLLERLLKQLYKHDARLKRELTTWEWEQFFPLRPTLKLCTLVLQR